MRRAESLPACCRAAAAAPNGYSILSYLTDKTYRPGSYQSRTYSAAPRARGAGGKFEPLSTDYTQGPTGTNKLYTKPVAVLIVYPTVVALQAGQDPVLAAALRYLGAPTKPAEQTVTKRNSIH